MSLGKNTPSGFLTGTPSIDDLMERIGKPGWAGLDATAAGAEIQKAVESAAAQLKRDYSIFLSHPAGKRILEDLLDQSLRRSPYMPLGNGKDFNLEQQTVYGLERMGQNGLMTYILKMIVDGQELTAPDTTKTTSKKKGK